MARSSFFNETATLVSPTLGGTGVANNALNTITFVGSYGTTFTLSGTTALTLPASGTVATLAGSEELLNKTLNAPVVKGTWGLSGTWTIPAVTATTIAFGTGAPSGNNIIAVNIASATGRFESWQNTLGEALSGVDATGVAYYVLNTGTAGATYGSLSNAPVIFYANNLAAFSITPGATLATQQCRVCSTRTGVTPTTAALRVDGSLLAANSIVSIGPTSGVGYATGAGGAVTQITSRTTGVTVNTVAGAITLFSAAGSATPASFTVTNSAVAATDVVIVNQKSGTDLYEIFVTAVAAGSFRITSFTTGGTTTEQPVFNFAVIKGVTS